MGGKENLCSRATFHFHFRGSDSFQEAIKSPGETIRRFLKRTIEQNALEPCPSGPFGPEKRFSRKVPSPSRLCFTRIAAIGRQTTSGQSALSPPPPICQFCPHFSLEGRFVVSTVSFGFPSNQAKVLWSSPVAVAIEAALCNTVVFVVVFFLPWSVLVLLFALFGSGGLQRSRPIFSKPDIIF